MPTSNRATISKAYVDARGEVKRAALVEINGTEVDRPPPDGADAASYYSTLTVVKLKDLLRSKGLRVSGKKANLIERLVSSKSKSAKPTKVVSRTTTVYRDNSMIDLTLDSPRAAGIADSLGALKLNDAVVDTERNMTAVKENVANGRGWDFKEGMCAVDEEMRKDDDVAATVEDERRRAHERIQKQREEEEEKLKREAAAKEDERMRLEVSEYVRRKQEEAQDAAIQERAKSTDRLIAEKRKHDEQTNLVERTLRAAETEKFAHYDVFGISHASSAAEVNKAYRKLALKLHPDKLGQNATPKSRETFNAISNAYEVLKDPSSRSKYDREQGSIRGGDIPPAAVPRDEPSSHWNTIRVGTRITVQDSAYYSNGAQGAIQSYDEILDRYYVMLDNTTGQMLFEKSALFQNVVVLLRSATAIEFGVTIARLLRYKTCSNGRCYEMRVSDATTFATRTVDLQPNQFIIPFGTVVRLKYGNRYHGMIVGWTESFEQHSRVDVSYYQVKMSLHVIQNVHMMNIEL
jgi:hypothetical protein